MKKTTDPAFVRVESSTTDAWEPGAEAPSRTVAQVQQSRRSSGLTGELLLQMKGASGASAVHEAAAHGIQGSGGALPHLGRIQESFGRHDVTAVQAHTDVNAQRATTAMGAEAYATGNHVAFQGGAPSLHTAAHEAAHVVQQRAGVSLSGGVGQVGDSYEQHADAVADAVVQGRSAESILDRFAGGGDGAVQRKEVQFELTRGRNTGWGVFGWVEGGEKLWNDLNRKFNTELGQLKGELNALKAPNPFASEALQLIVDEIDKLIEEYDGDIHHDKAEELDGLLDGILKRGREVKDKVANDRAGVFNPLIERLGDALTSLSINYGKYGKGLSNSRKNLKSDLERLRDNTSSSFDTEELTSQIEEVEESFKDARDKTQEDRDKKLRDQQEQEKKERKEQEEQERVDEVKRKVEQKIPRYRNLLSMCNDIDQLHGLAERISIGEGGKLGNCLQLAGHADNLIQVMDVHGTDVDTMNRLLSGVGSGKSEELEQMLKAISSGQEGKLIDILAEVNRKDHKFVTPLLKKLGATTLLQLLDQSSAKELNALFVVKNVNVAKTRDLLGTDAGPQTVALLQKVPDSAFLVKLQPIAGASLGKLVADLPNNVSSIEDVKGLLANEETKLDDILDENSVKKARGLLTNAGSEIGEVTVDGLGSEHEKTHVKKALAAVNSNTAQTLTHSSGAKFGDAFDNIQGRLPGIPGAGGYKEYYVEKDPAATTYHGDRRLVKHDVTGHIYYTDDHYTTFKRIA